MATDRLTEAQARGHAAQALRTTEDELRSEAGERGWLLFVPVTELIGNRAVYVSHHGEVHDVPSGVPDVADMERRLAGSDVFRSGTRRP